jgi:hypothetical protein
VDGRRREGQPARSHLAAPATAVAPAVPRAPLRRGEAGLPGPHRRAQPGLAVARRPGPEAPQVRARVERRRQAVPPAPAVLSRAAALVPLGLEPVAPDPAVARRRLEREEQRAQEERRDPSARPSSATAATTTATASSTKGAPSADNRSGPEPCR